MTTRPGSFSIVMTRRAICVVAWLIIVAIDALAIWALIDGTFLGSMAASLPLEKRMLAQEMMVMTYVAIAGIIAVTLSYATIGLLLSLRPGGGRVGAILLAGGAGLAAVAVGYMVGGTLVIRDPVSPVANALFLVGPVASVFAFPLILPVVALTFPDGHLPSRSWRWPAGVALGALAVATTLTILEPGVVDPGTPSRNPLGVDAIPPWLSSLAGPLTILGVVLTSVLGIAAIATRYRRASGLERQQLRWFVAAVLLAAVPITMAPLSAGSAGPSWFIVALFGVLLIPVSVWIAVTRYRLYEIDRLISRGVSWAVLSGLLVAIYAGAVILLQGALGGVTQSETLAVAGSTLLAAALFQPLRRRVQSGVDRRFDRARFDAERTTAAFSERLRDQVDIAAVVDDLDRTVREALKPTTIGLWLRTGPAVK
jgi:hypothetical protein